MILVLANGGAATLFENSADGKYPAETLIIRELISHVDATYRTIASRSGRAIEGFSMGGRGATGLALKYPELFCSLHDQSGKVLHLADLYDPSRPNQYPYNYLGPDRARCVDDDVFLLIVKNAAAIKAGLRIEITCGTKDAVHIRSIRELHSALLAAGIDHTYVEVEGVAHDHESILRRYASIWFDYHAESFARR
jgi:endo-1,4-beta-xylanase